MATFTIKRQKVVVIPQRFKRSLHRRSVELLRGAIQAFLIEAARHIRIDTGMSLGSLIPISRFVGIAFPISGGKRTRKGYMVGFDRGTWVSGVTKNISAGESLSQQGDNWDVDFGSDNRFSMSFRFEAVIFQHRLHDLGLGGMAPWRSIEQGRAAFAQYIIENQLEVVPKFFEYLTFEGSA